MCPWLCELVGRPERLLQFLRSAISTSWFLQGQGGLLLPLCLRFFISTMGAMILRQRCCAEAMPRPMLVWHTAGLLGQLGPCQGLGSEVSLSLYTWLGAGGC